MATQPDDKQAAPAPLSERLQNYLTEIQSLVRQGVEHPRNEFKRATSIAREDLDDRLDFLKLLQGVANAEVLEERFIVIGADPTQRAFHPLANAADFDPARVTPVLAKYFDPLPQLEIFNNLQTDDGHSIVVLILNAVQPRPIIVKTEGQRSDGKIRLQVGDIWIKKGTALQLATRDDLDAMYRQRMEEEAEDRARKRFKHFTELSGAPHTLAPVQTRMPVRELLVEPAPDFRKFAEELIAANDRARFLMLIELIRETLAEGWDKHEVRQPMPPAELQAYGDLINDFFRDEFLPALQSAVTMALLIIKYDFETEWFQAVIDLLVKAFDEAHQLQRLKFGYFSQRPGALRYWRPGFEIFVALKCIATFAVMRDKPRFFSSLLRPTVVPIEIDESSRSPTPILYWPLPAQMFAADAMNEGRSTFFWKERISSSWGTYFVTYERFLAASYQLEFLLEFNSHVATNAVRDPELQGWIKVNVSHIYYSYVPDLFAQSLQLAIPMADKLYDAILVTDPSPSPYEIAPGLFAAIWKKKTHDRRVYLYGEFLDNLKAWQSQTMMQSFRRFPFMFSWQGRLAEAVLKYREQRPKPTQN